MHTANYFRILGRRPEKMKSKLEPWTPTPDELRDFQDGDRTREWLMSQPSDVIRKFEGKWIAAIDCAIVASADTQEQLYSQLSDPSPRLIIEFIPRQCAQRIVYIY